MLGGLNPWAILSLARDLEISTNECHLEDTMSSHVGMLVRPNVEASTKL